MKVAHTLTLVNWRNEITFYVHLLSCWADDPFDDEMINQENQFFGISSILLKIFVLDVVFSTIIITYSLMFSKKEDET